MSIELKSLVCLATILTNVSVRLIAQCLKHTQSSNEGYSSQSIKPPHLYWLSSGE
ncbi:hypothetical protein COEREDRAFT_79643 [Coemansia reversa NRRL 1564]|uniref:Uncharacterized protein n=1 Tax=Coemansia reversa (strain ATCC 12441 / NRRL 1564) TaxID=763665 RepID=A0A2G5BHY6_COERN|nr:hypothetical protein COEREDRAFT_79643 [Coemansia reversa NRRL 1564]|eukprot:PIA18613.1 hypothetical protein COEREDRAFT_79643 [Coemansia reversa NRRL 1564]